MRKSIQVVLVEDNAGDARLLREMFRAEPPGSIELVHFLRLGEALTHLAKNSADILLLDMGLPDGHGLDTVRRARAAVPGVPLIVLTGLDDEALAADAMKEGAQDYLIKGQIENRALPRALRHAIDRNRMQTESDLLRSDQMTFKDEFLSHVSHELRSPLTAIYQFVTILLDRLAGELKPEQREYLEIVMRNVKQLHLMINDLLEVTRVQAGKLIIESQRTSVADAVTYVVKTLGAAAAEKDITLSSDLEDDLPLIHADPARLRQILIILVDNAIKFTPADGSVKVHARQLEDDPGLMILEVSDTGIGISPETSERIFERLFQATDPSMAGRNGLGLGLYICKELVTRQGGNIWAKSPPGQGAVFSVTLPVFSLSNLIAPAFANERRKLTPITLITTEMGSQTGWLSNEVRTEHSQLVRSVLQSCLHSDLDVLLPKMCTTDAAELFFIVAVTDAIGGAAIKHRIQEKVDECEYIHHAGLTLSTSFRQLTPIRRNEGEPRDAMLKRVAHTIEKRMNEEISSRKAGND